MQVQAWEEADHVMKPAWATFKALQFLQFLAPSWFEYKDHLWSAEFEEMPNLIESF